MIAPKLLSDITIGDLKAHQWCYYHDEDEGYDAFEYVISDTHPNYSSEIAGIELAEFIFSNGITVYGSYDGSESFTIEVNGQWYSLWYGIAKPEPSDIERFSALCQNLALTFPVTATGKHSKAIKNFGGVQYLDSAGKACEICI